MSHAHPAKVVSVSTKSTHEFSKDPQSVITLVKGLGVEGDAHMGEKVKHRSRVARDPNQPNYRQVHLIHQELFAELEAKGYNLNPGDIGENILTSGLDLLALPEGTRLAIGKTALIEITGLRNPCNQLNIFQEGLMQALLDKDAEGNLIRKAGVMAIVLESGPVKPGDNIAVHLPDEPHESLKPV